MLRANVGLLLGFVMVAGCVPRQASYSPPSYSYRPSESERATQGAVWAREAIRSGSRQPLTIAQVQSDVRSTMRDPESVRFRNLRRNTETGAVCGDLNARNGYGGYVGEAPFIYYHSQNASVPQLMSGTDVVTTTIALTAAHCPVGPSTVTTDPTTPRSSRTPARPVGGAPSRPAAGEI